MIGPDDGTNVLSSVLLGDGVSRRYHFPFKTVSPYTFVHDLLPLTYPSVGVGGCTRLGLGESTLLRSP